MAIMDLAIRYGRKKGFTFCETYIARSTSCER